MELTRGGSERRAAGRGAADTEAVVSTMLHGKRTSLVTRNKTDEGIGGGGEGARRSRDGAGEQEPAPIGIKGAARGERPWVRSTRAEPGIGQLGNGKGQRDSSALSRKRQNTDNA